MRRFRVILTVVAALAAGCSSAAVIHRASFESTTTVASTSTTTTIPPTTTTVAVPTCTARGALPDPHCTPGALNPAVTQANIASTICAKGFAPAGRPTAAVLAAIKAEQIRAYRRAGAFALFDLDHLVPLSLGGAPSAVANLWPEPWAGLGGAHAKDAVEDRLHALVCARKLDLAVAQHEIASDWVTAH